MAWNHKRYYTRTIRRDGRQVRQYLGCRALALQIAESDQRMRERRNRILLERSAFDDALATIEALNVEYTLFAKIAAAVSRLEAGCHNHRGQWRKKRVRPNACPSPQHCTTS